MHIFAEIDHSQLVKTQFPRHLHVLFMALDPSQQSKCMRSNYAIIYTTCMREEDTTKKSDIAT